MSDKQLVLDAVREMPDDASLETICYKIAALADSQESASKNPKLSSLEIKKLPVFGMWADRPDMADSIEWVRKERETWHQRLTRQD